MFTRYCLLLLPSNIVAAKFSTQNLPQMERESVVEASPSSLAYVKMAEVSFSPQSLSTLEVFS